MKLIVGVDGSDGSFAAVSLAARLTDPARDQMALYYSPVGVSPLASDEGGEMRDRARQALADAVFAQARKLLPQAIADRVHTIVSSHQPAQGLILAATSWRADAIAVGARGLGPIQSLLLGSVSRQVVQAGALPVLVARSATKKSQASGLRLLLAYDPASAAAQAAAVSQFSWPQGTTGRVIRVVESLLAGQLPSWLEQQARDADAEAMAKAWVQEHEEEVRQQREEVSGYLRTLPAPFQGQPPLVVEGHPADQILKAIDAERADLVVVGKTAGGPLSDVLLGSTSSRVLSHASCSVFVVPPQP